MSDRLAELRRQRALMQEHLAWLDREIAEASSTATARDPESGGTAAAGAAHALGSATAPGNVGPPAAPGRAAGLPPRAGTSAPGGGPAAHAPRPSSGPAAAGEDPDAILAEYRVASDSLRTDVRKGCFFYFAAAFAVLIAVVAILYLLLSSR